MCVLSCSVVSNPDSGIPWTVALQSPLSMEFSRQEYRSGLPFPTPGNLPNPEIKPKSLVSLALDSWILYHFTPGKFVLYIHTFKFISNTGGLFKIRQEENIRISIVSITSCLIYISVHDLT